MFVRVFQRSDGLENHMKAYYRWQKGSEQTYLWIVNLYFSNVFKFIDWIVIVVDQEQTVRLLSLHLLIRNQIID